MLFRGDNLEIMRRFETSSIDAIVTDPPYGWRFMGKAWDGDDIEKMAKSSQGQQLDRQELGWKPREKRAHAAGKYDLSISANKSFEIWTTQWAKEAFRVLKPGAHMLVFCGPRTYHRMASGVEDAGFEIRDQLQWLFGSGFPKSHNLKDEWQGWGSALKPANEPIVLARKPLQESTLAKNVLKFGTGALNIDGTRIAGKLWKSHVGDGLAKNKFFTDGERTVYEKHPHTQGRWPANIILDEEAGKMLDEQVSKTMNMPSAGNKKSKLANPESSMFGISGEGNPDYYKDSGGASRFFYCAKVSKSERGVDNKHPTVKPIKLMEYLCKLITPPKGIVLDPFMGSGTTGIAAKNLGFDFIGIELDKDYFEIAEKRINTNNKATLKETQLEMAT